MSETTEIIKTVAPIAAPFVTAIVDTFVKPKLQKLSEFLKKEEASNVLSLEAKFQEYLERSYEHHAFVNVLAFQNQQKKLIDIYIPLTVVNENSNEKYFLEEYKSDFIPKYKKVLVSDTAGMGKSTLTKNLFLSVIEKNQGIPIFIEMRKLRGEISIFKYVHNELNPVDNEFDEDFVRRLIRDGNFIFFFDGYDEVPLSQREEVNTSLKDFISKAGKNFFIITSRPESSLASFPDFLNFGIQPLKLEESFELLKKYDNGGEISGEIISKLEGETLNSIKEFLINPLLVSLLYKSYEYKRKIPLKKHLFYRQVFDSLYENHDLTKNPPLIRPKFSNLEIDDFHRVMRALGFITMKRGEVEYDKDTLLSLIKQSNERCVGLDFRESDFLKDLLSIVPLFNRDGGYYKWAHKSLQDYFAAQFIWHDSGENKTEVLRKIVRSEENQKYLNVLDLYYDIDFKTFKHIIIYDFLTEFLNYYDSAFPFINDQKTVDQEISDLKLFTFGKFILFYPDSSAVYEALNDLEFGKKNAVTTTNKILTQSNEDAIGENYKLYRRQSFLVSALSNEPTFRRSEENRHNGLEYFGNHNWFISTFLCTKKLDVFYSDEELNEIKIRNFKPPVMLPNNFCVILSENSYLKFIKQLGLLSINAIFGRFLNPDDTSDRLLNSKNCRKMKEEIDAEIEREKSSKLFDKF